MRHLFQCKLPTAQLCTIVKYAKGYKINKRFLGFYDANDKSALRLDDVIKHIKLLLPY